MDSETATPGRRNMDTITLSKAKSELCIGRDRLLKLLKDCQIEVIQVNAQRKEITFKQLEHLRSIIVSGSEATPYQNPTQVNSGEPVQLVDLPQNPTIGKEIHQEQIRLAVLESQIEMMREQLSKAEKQLEKTETLLQEERTGRDQLQQMLAIEQTERRKVTQQLLESPKASPVEETIYSDVEPSQYNKPSGGWFSKIFAQT